MIDSVASSGLDAISTQQAADAVLLLEQGHMMSGAGKLLGAGEPGGAGADDGHALAGAQGRDLGLDPALLPGLGDDGALDGLDGHRHVVDVERAGRLAGGVADATGKLGEVVGGVQDLAGGLGPGGFGVGLADGDARLSAMAGFPGGGME
jgi:hypothetical protein